MSEEVTIVTRFRTEGVDDQNRKLRETSAQMTAFAKQMDGAVEVSTDCAPSWMAPPTG